MDTLNYTTFAVFPIQYDNVPVHVLPWYCGTILNFSLANQEWMLLIRDFNR